MSFENKYHPYSNLLGRPARTWLDVAEWWMRVCLEELHQGNIELALQACNNALSRLDWYDTDRDFKLPEIFPYVSNEVS